MEIIEVASSTRSEMIEITERVERLVRGSGVREGAVVLQSLHTTAGLTVNENADPDVMRDFTRKVDELFPKGEAFYRHAEGNSDSHLKTSFVGPSLTVLVDEGRLVLGTWQGIYLCEWDGPRPRRIAARVLTGV